MVYSDATAMSLSTFRLTILQHLYYYHVQRTGMKRRVALCHMIYKKVTEQEVITGTAETPKVNPAQQRRGPSHGKARHLSLPLPGPRVGRCRPRGAKQKRRCERDEEKDDTERPTGRRGDGVRLTGSRGGRQGEEESECGRLGEEEREEIECGRQGEEATMWRSRGGRRRAWPTVCWGSWTCSVYAKRLWVEMHVAKEVSCVSVYISMFWHVYVETYVEMCVPMDVCPNKDLILYLSACEMRECGWNEKTNTGYKCHVLLANGVNSCMWTSIKTGATPQWSHVPEQKQLYVCLFGMWKPTCSMT
ncbi:uncharacterized protein LOC121178101 isoform X2 [Toxotes jaculatrix]|uniref:uncharacterized protein LOC121178101 isoform X2 n=1 Tax=Toxotes jaculatrix TaxID=941984 RepID=UPI001B3A992F|nr:uncharacterized protein LOC121178101 isoform X2 [Toxotes jaculatrix]